MHPLVREKHQELNDLCRTYRVRRLEIFGSAAQRGPDHEPRDLDFLVEFLPLQSGEYADVYFGLLFALEELFGRPIDLVMTAAIRNPYFLRGIRRSRKVIYEANSEQAPL